MGGSVRQSDRRPLRRDALVAACCGAVVVSMVGAAYAAVPLYNWFCKTTGFGGTTQVSEKAPDHVLERTITIRFDSNVTPGLPWKFVPEQNEIKVRIGEVATVNYKVVNEVAREIVGQASYNVSPPTVGAYFSKINCFCFTEQRMALEGLPVRDDQLYSLQVFTSVLGGGMSSRLFQEVREIRGLCYSIHVA